jgi:hypothetical protein
MPSDMLVYDLQFRLRCSHCNRRGGFRITIFDNRTRGDNSKPRLERVAAAADGRSVVFFSRVAGIIRAALVLQKE